MITEAERPAGVELAEYTQMGKLVIDKCELSCRIHFLSRATQPHRGVVIINRGRLLPSADTPLGASVIVEVPRLAIYSPAVSLGHVLGIIRFQVLYITCSLLFFLQALLGRSSIRMSGDGPQPTYPPSLFNTYTIAFEGSSVACILFGKHSNTHSRLPLLTSAVDRRLSRHYRGEYIPA